MMCVYGYRMSRRYDKKRIYNLNLSSFHFYHACITTIQTQELATAIPPFSGLPVDVSDGNLIAYYPFNGNADDESGNGNNGI